MLYVLAFAHRARCALARVVLLPAYSVQAGALPFGRTRTNWTATVRGALAVGGALQMLGWSWYVAALWRQEGLFSRIGLDYGFFWATARAYLLDGSRALFDLDAIARAAAPLVAYYALPTGVPLNVAPAVYPPLFFALLAPLTGVPPLLGFALWTGAGIVAAAAALHGAWREAAPRFPATGGLLASAISCGPLALGLLLGQVEGLLLFVLYRVYRALQQEHDLAAGLWLGLLCLKPQYAVFLALVLGFKRRWRAMAGLVAAGGVVVLLSLVVVGAGGVQAYRQALVEAAAFRPPEASAHAPGDMISWRGLLFTLWPAATQRAGTTLTLALSMVTIVFLPLVWWGRWQPGDHRFARRMLATILVTMLASFHNHLHGAALALVPAMAVAAQPGGSRGLNLLLLTGLYLPSVVFWASGDLALTAQAVAGLIIAALLMVVLQEARDLWCAWRRRRGRGASYVQFVARSRASEQT